MFIRTERLFLRPVFEEDWREVLAGIGDESVVRMLARPPWPYGEADAREACSRSEDLHSPRFAITLPDVVGAPLIGLIGLGAQDEGHELGYWIARRHWGQGYAVEAARGVLEIARAIGIQRVVAGHYLDNPASGRVLRKAGLVETGEVRPVFCNGRGGEMVLARRYALELNDADRVEDVEMPRVA